MLLVNIDVHVLFIFFTSLWGVKIFLTVRLDAVAFYADECVMVIQIGITEIIKRLKLDLLEYRLLSFSFIRWWI